MSSEVVSSKQIVKASKWSVLAEIMAKIAVPIVNIFLARLLDPDVFGVIASITIITSFADLFTDAGFQRYIIQHEFCSEDELDKYTNVSFWSNLFLSSVIYLIIVLFCKPLASFVGCKEAYMGIVVAALAVICTSFSSTATARYRRSLDFKPLFVSRMVSVFIPLIVTVPLAFFFRSYWVMIIGTLAQKIFQAVYLTIISKWKPKKYYSVSILKKMIPFSTWNLLESLAIWFAGQANIFIVANTLNSHYLGLYKTGMATVNSYMAVITASITPVLFSALSRFQNEKTSYERTFYRFQKIISLLVLPMGVGLLMYRDLAVKILLGSKWMEVASFLGLWAFISSLTITYSNTASEVYRSKGKPKVSFILQMGYMVAYIPAIYYGANIDFSTLCLISCLIRILPIIFDLLALNFLFDIKISKMYINTFPSLISTVLMLGLILLLQNVSSGVVWSIISIIICVVFYATVSLLFPSNRSIISSIPVFGKLLKKGKE